MRPHVMLSVALKATNGFMVDWRYGCQSRKRRVGDRAAVSTLTSRQRHSIPSSTTYATHQTVLPCLVCLEASESTDPRCGLSSGMNLAPFHEIPPTLKFLPVTTPSTLPISLVFNLIRSIPFPEDPTLIGGANINHDDPYGPHTITPSPPSPLSTGTLGPCAIGEIAGTARRLLNPPNGPHFRKLRL